MFLFTCKLRRLRSFLKTTHFGFVGANVPNGVNGVNGHAEGINGHTDGINGHAEPGAQHKPSLRLSFAEYKRISNLLVLHLRRVEDGERRPLPCVYFCCTFSNGCVCFSSAAEEEEELKKASVVNWYLKEIEAEIDSEEELVNKKGLIEKVIHRLVHFVSPPSGDASVKPFKRSALLTCLPLLLGSHPHRAVPGGAEGLGV